MDPDLALIIGLILGVFAVPSIMSAFSEGRPPRVAAFTVIAAGVLIIWAISKKPQYIGAVLAPIHVVTHQNDAVILRNTL